MNEQAEVEFKDLEGGLATPEQIKQVAEAICGSYLINEGLTSSEAEYILSQADPSDLCYEIEERITPLIKYVRRLVHSKNVLGRVAHYLASRKDNNSARHDGDVAELSHDWGWTGDMKLLNGEVVLNRLMETDILAHCLDIGDLWERVKSNEDLSRSLRNGIILCDWKSVSSNDGCLRVNCLKDHCGCLCEQNYSLSNFWSSHLVTLYFKH